MSIDTAIKLTNHLNQCYDVKKELVPEFQELKVQKCLDQFLSLKEMKPDELKTFVNDAKTIRQTANQGVSGAKILKIVGKMLLVVGTVFLSIGVASSIGLMTMPLTAFKVAGITLGAFFWGASAVLFGNYSIDLDVKEALKKNHNKILEITKEFNAMDNQLLGYFFKIMKVLQRDFVINATDQNKDKKESAIEYVKKFANIYIQRLESSRFVKEAFNQQCSLYSMDSI